MLTAAITHDQVLEAIKLGVRGLVLKRSAPETLVTCVRRVYQGKEWIDRDTLTRAFRTVLDREAASREAAETLTVREIEIVRMIGHGLRNRSIADRLSISEGTVKVHLHNIYEKLGVDGRLELVLFAQQKRPDLIPLPATVRTARYRANYPGRVATGIANSTREPAELDSMASRPSRAATRSRRLRDPRCASLGHRARAGHEREASAVIDHDDIQFSVARVDRDHDATGMCVLERVDHRFVNHEAKALFARHREREIRWIDVNKNRDFPFRGQA